MTNPFNFLNVGAWNVQGIFTMVNKVKLCKLADNEFEKRLRTFNIIALQEIKCGPEESQKFSLHDFRLIPFHRKISSNNRYIGGTLLLNKNRIKKGVKVIDNLQGDKIWIKLDKLFFNLENNLFICFTYAPLARHPI